MPQQGTLSSVKVMADEQMPVLEEVRDALLDRLGLAAQFLALGRVAGPSARQFRLLLGQPLIDGQLPSRGEECALTIPISIKSDSAGGRGES